MLSEAVLVIVIMVSIALDFDAYRRHHVAMFNGIHSVFFCGPTCRASYLARTQLSSRANSARMAEPLLAFPLLSINAMQLLLRTLRIIPLFASICLCASLAFAVDIAPLKQNASDTFFRSNEVPKLRLEVAPGEMEKLRQDPRNYVRAILRENEAKVYGEVAIKLKGAAGSYRDVDDRPALTINVSKYRKKERFHDLEKFHLNNSVQDESMLSELLCSELFLKAGIPCARATHARVFLNDRDLGMYVFKEGFDENFLARYFKDPEGNLYDGGFLQDLDSDLEKDEGSGPDDRQDLKAIVAASQLTDLSERYRRVESLVDLDRFLTFMAIERMACHWDGYVMSRNNYRLYMNPEDHRAEFFPHGMDQMFGDTGMSLFDFPQSILGTLVIEHAEWRNRYRQRVRELLPLFLPPDALLQRIDQISTKLEPALKELNDDAVRSHRERANDFKRRIAERAENLKQQLEYPDLMPEAFDDQGKLQLEGWWGSAESEGVEHHEVELPGVVKAYEVRCNRQADFVGSWRRHVLLGPGKYTFQARVRCRDVKPKQDEPDAGVGIRLSRSPRGQVLINTRDWTTMTFEFEVLEELKQIELVAEIRAARGTVWFDAAGFQLLKK